jgi:hypothetical protein
MEFITDLSITLPMLKVSFCQPMSELLEYSFKSYAICCHFMNFEIMNVNMVYAFTSKRLFLDEKKQSTKVICNGFFYSESEN